MFLFCEICFRRPNTVGNLLISSCRHLFCRRCANSTTNCTVCKEPCRIIELRKDNLPEQLKDYFVPASELISKAVKVCTLQFEKQDLFIAGNIHILEKYEEKKKKLLKLREHYDALKKAMDEEIALIRKMRAQRKSSSVLNISPTSPLSVQPQMQSLRISTLKRNTLEQGLKRNRNSDSDSSGIGSSRASRLDRSRSQGSNISSAKRITPTDTRGSGGSSGGAKQSISPIETFKKPLDLVSTARAGIYHEAMRSINNAMRRPTESVVKVNKRGSDTERARNVYF